MARHGSLSVDTWLPDETSCLTREQVLKARGYPLPKVKVKRIKKAVKK